MGLTGAATTSRTKSTTGREGNPHASAGSSYVAASRLKRDVASQTPVSVVTVKSRPPRLPAGSGRASTERASNGHCTTPEQKPERATALAASVLYSTVDQPPHHDTASERRATTVGASHRPSTHPGQQPLTATALGKLSASRKTRSAGFTVNQPQNHETASERRTTTVGASPMRSTPLGQQPLTAAAIGVPSASRETHFADSTGDQLQKHDTRVEWRATTVGALPKRSLHPGQKPLTATALGKSSVSRKPRVADPTVNQTPARHHAQERHAATMGASSRCSTSSGEPRSRVSSYDTSSDYRERLILDFTDNQTPLPLHTAIERRDTKVYALGTSSITSGRTPLRAPVPSKSSGHSGALPAPQHQDNNIARMERCATPVGISSERASNSGQKPPVAIVPNTSSGRPIARNRDYKQQTEHEETTHTERRTPAIGTSLGRASTSGRTPSLAPVPSTSSGCLGALMPELQDENPMCQEQHTTAVGASYERSIDLGRKLSLATVPSTSSGRSSKFLLEYQDGIPTHEERRATTVGASKRCSNTLGKNPSRVSDLGTSTGSRNS